MKKLFVSQSLIEVESRQEWLEDAGIPCMLKNRQGSSLAGEVPFAEVFPELWVNDEDFDRANEMLEQRSRGPEPSPTAWVCSGCGQKHEGEFTACWKCGREKGQKVDVVPAAPHQSENVPPGASSSGELFLAMLFGAILSLGSYWLWNVFSLEGSRYDRNGDGKDDVIEEYRGQTIQSAKYDNDFDGYFETTYAYNRHGYVTHAEIDRDRDGKPDVIAQNTLGKLDTVELIDSETRKVRKRIFYRLDIKVREELDEDGDGRFERVVQFDEYENPKP